MHVFAEELDVDDALWRFEASHTAVGVGHYAGPFLLQRCVQKELPSGADEDFSARLAYRKGRKGTGFAGPRVCAVQMGYKLWRAVKESCSWVTGCRMESRQFCSAMQPAR